MVGVGGVGLDMMLVGAGARESQYCSSIVDIYLLRGKAGWWIRRPVRAGIL
jgi:hypothetical protein